MAATLIFRPQPYVDEGLNGYLLRLAEGNRIGQIKRLWKGIPAVQDELARLLGMSEPPWSERLFKQSDQKGNRPMWNSSTSRFCPECLRAQNYWKQDWELSLMSACPIHRCLLVEVCLNCQHTLRWSRKSLLYCHCGSDLRHMHTEHADDKEIELAQTLSNKLHGQDSDIPNLQPLNLKQTHSLLVTLGVYANPERRIDLRNQSINSQSSARALVLSASHVLFNWPDSFHQMLDQIQKVSEKKNTARLGKRFGKFYEYLYTNYRGPEFGFLMHEFENYLENNWKHAIAARNKRLSGRIRNGHIWVPAHTIAVELNVSRKAIASLIEAGEIDSSRVTTPKGREVICINRLQRELIQSLIHDRVDLKMAAELLGVKENRVCQLYEHHLLGKVISAKENASGRWQLSRSSLEQILILGGNLPVAESDYDLIGLRHLLHYVLNKPFLFPRLILAVMKREILPVAVCKQEQGLSAWQFKRSQFTGWHIEQLKGARKGAFTIPEAAKYLKIKQQVAYHLVGSGYIKCVLEEDSQVRLVTLSNLEDFKRNYALGVELSKQLNISPKHLCELLEYHDIWPVSGHGVDGGRQIIYRRDLALKRAMRDLVEISPMLD